MFYAVFKWGWMFSVPSIIQCLGGSGKFPLKPNNALKFTLIVFYEQYELLTYLCFTGFVGVIIQMQMLHVKEIFDVTLSVASSTCAT